MQYVKDLIINFAFSSTAVSFGGGKKKEKHIKDGILVS